MKCAVLNCKNTITAKKPLKFYPFPRKESVLKKWIQFCRQADWFDEKRARICSVHFTPDDIEKDNEMGFRRQALKPNSIPTVVHRPPMTPVSLLPSTKEHIELINEEFFDETILDPLEISEEDGEEEERSTQDIDMLEHVCENSCTKSVPYISKGVQTGSLKTRTCGFIEVSVEKPIYNMICSYCGIDFPIWSWTKFVTHVKENHHNLEKSFTNTEDIYNEEEACIKKPSGLFKSQNDIIHKSKSRTLEEKTSTVKVFQIQSQNDIVSKSKTDPNTYKSRAPNESLSETKFKSPVYVSSENEHSYSASSADRDYSGDENNSKKSNEIRFDSTNTKVVMNFLELLRTYPIIYRGHKSATDYDNALSDLTDKFNAKWSLAITMTDMRRSINRIKEWYRRVYISKQRNPDFKQKFAEYFVKCAEFLTCAELRPTKPIVRCDLCKSRFSSEEKFQAHKFLHHNIGELPYKCSHCEDRFATADKVESHERSHTRERSYICEICKKGFYYEFKLTAHMKIHTEDNKKMCHVCGKKFKTLSRYRQHKVIHEARRFKCNLCSKAYYQNNYLVEHMKAHRNQRDHICDQCGKTFVRRKNLMDHKKTTHIQGGASGSKPYACRICGQEFRFYSCLYHHRKAKHLVLEGTVEELAINITGRTKHKYVIDPATNAKRVVCDVCGNTYSFISGLIAHKTKVHGYVRLKDKQLKSVTGQDDVGEVVPTEEDSEEAVVEDDVGEVVPTEADFQEAVVEDDQYEDENTEIEILFDDIIYTD